MAEEENSLADFTLIADANENDSVRVLVATDLHVGYAERIANRELDSVKAFEEVLLLAHKHNVDFILLGGDLYHQNSPSRETQLRVTRLLRRHCLNSRPVSLKFLSDPASNFEHSAFNSVNYEDSNINVGMPIFTIHGNHDDLTGKGLSALDLLHEAGLVNLFGKFQEIGKFVVSPILLKKGKTNLAIYGIGSQSDDRLCRAFREETIKFLRPREESESWFNILVLHQNRPRRSTERSTGGHLPESLIPTFFDLVIWGHEHECKIDPQYFESGNGVHGDGFYIMQPGSTIATSLSPEEALPKKVAVLTIVGRKFFSTPIALETPRQVLFADLTIDVDPPRGASNTRRLQNMPDEKQIDNKLKEMLREGERSRGPQQPPLPLVRLRVTYPHIWSAVLKLNSRHFGMKYSSEVANPAEMITLKFLRAKADHHRVEVDKQLFRNIDRTTTVEHLVNQHFTGDGEKKLVVLTAMMLGDVIRAQTELDEGGRRQKGKPIAENISSQKELLIDALCGLDYSDVIAVDNLGGSFKAGNLTGRVENDIVNARDSRIDERDKKHMETD